MLEYWQTIGIVAMEGRGFEYPTDTVAARNGRLYTLNRSRDFGERGVRVTVLDLDSEYYGTFGHLGDGEGRLISPTCAAESGQGHIYVADDYTHRISAFDYDGGFVSRWGAYGAAEGELNGPSGVAFDAEDNIYVADTHNNRVQKFTSSGVFLFAFGSAGSSEGKFSLPWGLTVAPDGDLYVVDWGNDRIQRFSPEGEFVRLTERRDGKRANCGVRPGSRLTSAAISTCPTGATRGYRFWTGDGRPLQVLRGEATLSKWAAGFMETNREEAAARASANLAPDLPDVYGGDPHTESAHIESLFWAPMSIKLDAAGLVYITEANRHRIQIYRRKPPLI